MVDIIIMSYKIAQINLSPAGNARNTSDIYVAQPDAFKEALAGKLFIVAEIENNNLGSLKTINFLIDKINHNYYNNEKILLREKISSLKVEHIFESVLAKTNSHISEFLQKEKIRLKLSDINICVGIIHENTLYFANSGKTKVLFIHKVKSPEIDANSEYKLTNITEKTQNEPRSGKLFSDVISGPMPSNSQFLITSETLPEYISNKELIRIISTLPPASAIEQIKQKLSQVNSFVSFLAIIIKSTKGEEAEAAKPASKISTYDSIIDLKKTEETTENLLTPSGLFNTKKWFSFGKRRKKASRMPAHAGGSASLKDSLYTKAKSGTSKNKIIIGGKNIFSYIANIFYYIFKFFTRKEKLRLILLFIKNKIFALFNIIFRKLGFLNKKNKILLALSLVFILMFIISISLNSRKQVKEEAAETYSAIWEDIEKKQNQAEASLLYSNEEGAKELFDEINALMQQLPAVTPEQKAKLDEFKEKFELQLEKIQKVERIYEIEKMADFTNINSQAKPKNISLILNKNKIYAADPLQKSIYSLDISNNIITTITDLEIEINDLSFPAINSQDTIYYMNNESIIAFDANNESMAELSINLLNEYQDFTGADIYSDRLYLLNAKNNQIFRFGRSGSSFTPAYAWMQDSVNLENAVDISIDGHIYILNNNGELLKFLKGRQVNFRLESIDPEIKNASQLFVSPEGKHIYILDPSENRLIIFDKTGQFIMQYKSDKFTDLKNFAVDEKNKIIYIINNTEVLKFSTKHLE